MEMIIGSGRKPVIHGRMVSSYTQFILLNFVSDVRQSY